MKNEENSKFNMNCDSCGKMCCFADDSTYSKSSKDTKKLTEEIATKYQDITNYMASNRLVLNTDKTHLLVMSTSIKHKKYQNFDIKLDTGNEIIEPIYSEKLLGGLISNDLKFNEHIRNNEKSLYRLLINRINALRKVSSISSFKTRKMLADGLVMSLLINLITVWGGCTGYLLTMIQTLQNRAARIVTKSGWRTPVKEMLLQCGWLSVKQLVEYHSLLLVFKIKKWGKATLS